MYSRSRDNKEGSWEQGGGFRGDPMFPDPRSQNVIERRGVVGPETVSYGGFNTLRPELNWDYVEQIRHPCFNGPRIHVEPLVQQERQLVEDLLNSFLGFSGYYIVPSLLKHPTDERRFIISPQVSPQLRTLVENILPLSSNYSLIVRFIQFNHSLTAGRVNQALSEYLDAEMQDFCQMVTVMEDKLVTGNINLSNLWSELQGFMKKLSILAEIARSAGSLRGGGTLSALHDSIPMTMADQMAQQMFCNATKAASSPFFDSLAKWIYSGVVLDPYNEFMIVEKTTKRGNPTDWDNIFVVRREHVPSFLVKAVDTIHSCGKYLDALRNSLGPLEEMPSATRQDLVYNFFDPHYLDIIHQAFDFANYELLRRLIVEREIVSRLDTTKALFSLQYGDLFNNILENCASELQRPVHSISKTYLSALMSSSLRTSSMRSLALYSNVAIHLADQSLLQQTMSLDNFSSPSRNPSEDQLGFDALTFQVTSTWPDCLVLHEKAIKCYQMLFRHFFYVKLVHHKVLQAHLQPLTVQQSALKHCILTFMTSCLSFMTQGTIEKNWVEFQANASKANSVEGLRSCHDDFLYKCLSNCMLTSADLYAKFTKTLDICSDFSNSPSDGTDFSKAVSDLFAASKEANLTGVQGFIAFLQPTYEYTINSTLSSTCSDVNSSSEEMFAN